MSEQTLSCPNCKTEIKLTESLAAPLVEAARKAFDAKLAAQDANIKNREMMMNKKASEMDLEVSQRVESEKTKIMSEAKRKVSLIMSNELNQKDKELLDLKEISDSKDVKLRAAQSQQAEFIKRERELEDSKRELDLTVETRISEGLEDVRQKAKTEVEGEQKLKLLEREQTIESMLKKIEELKKKADQGSQQMQGEVFELDFEKSLAEKFPIDNIEPVPKGEFGGDTLQRVVNSSSDVVGTILWELKRTKNWSDGWLVKLRGDQRAAKADVSIIVSHALPKGVEHFDKVDGVWIVQPRFALPIVIAIRQAILDVSVAKQSKKGQKTKTEMVYQYLTGSDFKLRVEAIAEAFTTMQDDLNKERKVITKQWAKRDQQITRVLESTVSMYGDLQGIAGASLADIEGLEVELLELDS